MNVWPSELVATMGECGGGGPQQLSGSVQNPSLTKTEEPLDR
jgi:hypothetical protein